MKTVKGEVTVILTDVKLPGTNNIVGPIEYTVDKLQIVNDGIGAYECHGFKGYDFGHDMIEDFDFVEVKVKDKHVKENSKLYTFLTGNDDIVERIFENLIERLEHGEFYNEDERDY